MRRILCVVSRLILAIAIAGCVSGKKPEETNLRDEWAKKLRPYGLTAIFPPRSTLQPGDVFLLCETHKPSAGLNNNEREGSDEHKGDTFEPVALLSLPGYGGAVASYFSTRLSLPRSITVADPKTAPIDIPTNDEGIDAAAPKWNRLGLASFPQVFQVEGTVAEGGISAAAGSTVFGFGGSRRTLSTYVLSMPSSEWAGLPMVPAMEAASVGLHEITDDQRATMYRVWRNARTKYSGCTKIRIIYATEVYYSRHLTLSYGETKAAAFAGQAALYVPPGSQRANVITALKPAASDQPASDPKAAGLSDKASEAEAQRQAAAASALASIRLGTPNAKANVSSEFGNSVSFDYMFAEPIAVGAVVVDLFEEDLNEDETKTESIIMTSEHSSSELAQIQDHALAAHVWSGAGQQLDLQQILPGVYIQPAATKKCSESDFACLASASRQAISDNTMRIGFIRGFGSGPFEIVNDPHGAKAIIRFTLALASSGNAEAPRVTMTCSGSGTVTWSGGKIDVPVKYSESNVQANTPPRGKPSGRDLFGGRCGAKLGELVRRQIENIHTGG